MLLSAVLASLALLRREVTDALPDGAESIGSRERNRERKKWRIRVSYKKGSYQFAFRHAGPISLIRHI